MAIEEIREELAEKQAEAARIEAILASTEELWAVVRAELVEIRKLYGEPRRTSIGLVEQREIEYSETDFIIEEKAYLIVTRGGWIKRQGSFSTLGKIRVRDGDEIGWIARGSTKNAAAFFTDKGGAYVLRLDDVPSTSGYGEPIQRHFSFSDGETVVGIALFDANALPKMPEAAQSSSCPSGPVRCRSHPSRPRHSLPAQSPQRGLQQVGPLLRSPERAHRPGGGGRVVDGTEHVSLATRDGRALAFPVRTSRL